MPKELLKSVENTEQLIKAINNYTDLYRFQIFHLVYLREKHLSIHSILKRLRSADYKRLDLYNKVTDCTLTVVLYGIF